MLIYFSEFYKKFFNSEKGHHKIATGLSIAALESYILCPLERIKVNYD